MRRFVVFLALGAFATAALAQLRTIPKEAKLGEIRHLQSMMVEINGQARQLAPGAQIRDPDNRLVLPVALGQRVLMRYLADPSGQVTRVWILSPAERAALPPSPFPK
jgi:hypothetical protein